MFDDIVRGITYDRDGREMSKLFGGGQNADLDVIKLHVIFFFFFSSRRRHTRCGRDWSSDVCSSDLFWWIHSVSTRSVHPWTRRRLRCRRARAKRTMEEIWLRLRRVGPLPTWVRSSEIGRASCRERV